MSVIDGMFFLWIVFLGTQAPVEWKILSLHSIYFPSASTLESETSARFSPNCCLPRLLVQGHGGRWQRGRFFCKAHALPPVSPGTPQVRRCGAVQRASGRFAGGAGRDGPRLPGRRWLRPRSSPQAPLPSFADPGAQAGRPPLQLRRPRAMQSLAMDLRVLSRELALYLEHQVRVGFFGSGMGLSLILGFSVAYACYYLSSIAKVSRGRGRRSVAGSGAPRARGDTSCPRRSRVLPRGSPGVPFPGPASTTAVLRGRHRRSVRVSSPPPSPGCD